MGQAFCCTVPSGVCKVIQRCSFNYIQQNVNVLFAASLTRSEVLRHHFGPWYNLFIFNIWKGPSQWFNPNLERVGLIAQRTVSFTLYSWGIYFEFSFLLFFWMFHCLLQWIKFQFASNCTFKIESRPNTSCNGVARTFLWYVDRWSYRSTDPFSIRNVIRENISWIWIPYDS